MTDASVARWVLDELGYWAAVKWVAVPALVAARNYPEGSGSPPSPNSALARALRADPETPSTVLLALGTVEDWSNPPKDPYKWD